MHKWSIWHSSLVALFMVSYIFYSPACYFINCLWYYLNILLKNKIASYFCFLTAFLGYFKLIESKSRHIWSHILTVATLQLPTVWTKHADLDWHYSPFSQRAVTFLDGGWKKINFSIADYKIPAGADCLWCLVVLFSQSVLLPSFTSFVPGYIIYMYLCKYMNRSQL